MVASGEAVSAYMGIPGWESDHVTLVLEGADVHQEIQLLFFHAPKIKVDSGAGALDRTGFNHVRFRVNDLAAMLEHLAANGIRPRTRSSTTTTASWSSWTARGSWSSWPSGERDDRGGGQSTHLEPQRIGAALGDHLSRQSMSLAVMSMAIAKASWAERWMLLRSVLRRSWP